MRMTIRQGGEETERALGGVLDIDGDGESKGRGIPSIEGLTMPRQNAEAIGEESGEGWPRTAVISSSLSVLCSLQTVHARAPATRLHSAASASYLSSSSL